MFTLGSFWTIFKFVQYVLHVLMFTWNRINYETKRVHTESHGCHGCTGIAGPQVYSCIFLNCSWLGLTNVSHSKIPSTKPFYKSSIKCRCQTSWYNIWFIIHGSQGRWTAMFRVTQFLWNTTYFENCWILEQEMKNHSGPFIWKCEITRPWSRPWSRDVSFHNIFRK